MATSDEKIASETLKTYLIKEFLDIRSDPNYKNNIHSGALMMFEEDRLFHIRKALDGDWLEWRILSFISLQLSVLGNNPPSAYLKSYLDQEFQTIQSDPDYKSNISNGRLGVVKNDLVFHIQDYLEGSYLEWRILSYNALRSHWLPTA